MERILITGASRGIGRAIAVKLASKGRLLLLQGRDRKSLEATLSLVKAKGAETELLLCDFSDPGQVDALVAKISKSPLDVLVNNAGIAIVKPLTELTLEDWQQTVAINITAPFQLMKGLVPGMNSGSSLVNILSIAAKTPFAGWSSYCMSKFAMDGFSRAVREEVRSAGIRVINIYPGSTDTTMWDSAPGDWPRERMIHPEAVAEAVAMALKQPAGVLVDDISLGPVGGAL